MKHYELIVIGSGPGGYMAAEYASKQGKNTLCIEEESFGGVCLNKGCIPTKTLLKSSKLNQDVRHISEFGIDGIDISKISLNWQKIQNRKKDVVDKLVRGVHGILKSAKVDIIKGHATMKDIKTVEVNNELFTYDNLIFATGSTARKFNLPGFLEAYEQKKVVTSDEALALESIPKTFTVIGGGVIGIEFAILYAELGSKVTILQGVDRILEILDKDISKEITKLLIEKGIIIETNVTIKEFKDDSVVYEKDNQVFYNKSDICLVSIGRKPNSELAQSIGLTIAPNGSIVVNNQMKTSVDNIYAIGDCSSKVMLAHSAYKNAIVAIDNIFNRKCNMDSNTIPSCIYTHPEVATVGKTEEQLIAENIEYCKVIYPMSHVGKTIVDGESFGFFKLLASKDIGEILGCHIVGEDASNLISEIVLAMKSESTVYTLVRTIHPHPTVSEVIWEAAKKLLVENYKDKKWF